jgi:hypothetical protein
MQTADFLHLALRRNSQHKEESDAAPPSLFAEFVLVCETHIDLVKQHDGRGVCGRLRQRPHGPGDGPRLRHDPALVGGVAGPQWPRELHLDLSSEDMQNASSATLRKDALLACDGPFAVPSAAGWRELCQSDRRAVVLSNTRQACTGRLA